MQELTVKIRALLRSNYDDLISASKFNFASKLLVAVLAVANVCCFGFAVWFCLHLLQHESMNLRFWPTNGDFQTFNPLRRLDAGQKMCVDFVPYLGVGLTYFIYSAYKLLGTGFLNSKFNVQFLLIIQSVISTILLYVYCYKTHARSSKGDSKFNKFTEAAIGLALLSFVTVILPMSCFVTLEMIFPGASVRGLRSFLPLVISLILLIVNRFCKFSIKNNYCLAAIFGFVAANCLFWSNDYGPATALALAMCALFFLVDYRDRRGALISVSFGLILFALSLILINFTYLNGGLTKWFEYNKDGVLADQAWYFLGPPMVTWIDLLKAFYGRWQLVLHLLCFFYIFRGFVKRDSFCIYNFLLVFIGLSVLFAQYIYCFGGHVERFSRVDHTVIVLLVGLLIQASKKFGFFRIAQLAILLLNLTCFTVGVANSKASVFKNMQKLRILSLPSTRREYEFISDLGGYLPKNLLPVLNFVNVVKTERIHPSGKKNKPYIVSDYSTLIEYMLDEFNPTGFDYIIHALGRNNRKIFTKTLDQRPKYVTTTTLSYFTESQRKLSAWYYWIIRANWNFYKRVVANFEPLMNLPYNMVWKQREIPLRRLTGVNCSFYRTDKNYYELTFSNPYNQNILADVTLHYELNTPQDWFGFPRYRVLLGNDYARAKFEYMHKADYPAYSKEDMICRSDIYVSLPLKSKIYNLPVELKPNPNEQIITLRLLPSNIGGIKLSSCEVNSAFYMKDTFEFKAKT